MAISANGWPVLQPDSTRLYTWNIPTKQGTVRLRLRNGSAGFLLALWVMIFAARIEAVVGKVLDDWGYAYRPIRGQSTGWSNHASGTAEDLNATQHPLGKVGTFVQAALIRLLLRRFRGLIDWGGDWHNRKDEMHFELAPGTTMSQCEARAKRLAKTRRGKALLAANPIQRAVIWS